MKHQQSEIQIQEFRLNDTGKFPNSVLPVIVYKKVLALPRFFKCFYVRRLFISNKWGNSWKSGIYEYHHYHSITHEVLGVCEGKTTLLLGGENGVSIEIEAGDVIVIPAGVAHKNEGNENDVCCIGAYPTGHDYDIKYGKEGERPSADNNIMNVSLPKTDPVFGAKFGVQNYWK
ncbi:MAG: cupin protein [Bacteroidetes bacterium]|jgi:uncharacterized protein YjlB|nr:cupin protein [Bacteroidota bacterium]